MAAAETGAAHQGSVAIVEAGKAEVLVVFGRDQKLVHTVSPEVDAAIALERNLERPSSIGILPKGTSRPAGLKFVEHVELIPDEAIQLVAVYGLDGLDPGAVAFSRS